MARTRLTPRAYYNQGNLVAKQLQQADQRRQGQRRQKQRAPRKGVKNIEKRVRNKRFKIKRMTAQPKNVKVKSNGRVVRKMAVRRATIYLAEVRTAYY